MRRLGLTVAVAALLGVVSLAATVSSAYAFAGPPSTVINDPATNPALRSLLGFSGTTAAEATGGAYTDASATALFRARVAAGTMPSLTLLSRISLAAGAFYAGYKIGGAIDQWLDISGTSTVTPATSGILTTWWWDYYSDVSGLDYSQPLYSAVPGYVLTGGTALGVGGVTAGGTNCGYSGDYYSMAAAYGGSLTYSYSNCGGGTMKGIYVASLSPTVRTRPWTTETPYGGGSTISGFSPANISASTYGSAEMTAARAVLTALPDAALVPIAMALDPAYTGLAPATFTMPNCDGLTYSACLALLTAAGHVGSISHNTWGISDAILATGAGLITSTTPGHSTTGVAAGASVTVNDNPTPLPLELQAQDANETAGHYLTRIGHTGTVTYVSLSPETSDSTLGASAPVRITFPAPGGGTQTLPVPKPGAATDTNPAHRLDPADPIEVQRNDPTMPPIVPPVDGGDCPCAIHDFNFGPLTSINYGDKFPFGILGWIADQWEHIDVGAVAPSLTVTIPAMDAGPFHIGAIGPYGWDFADERGQMFDGIIGLIRTSLTWFVWLGGLWFLGTRLLGIRGAPEGPSGVDGTPGD